MYMAKREWGRTDCNIQNCDRPHYAHGFCNPHWQRWKQHGDPQAHRPITRLRANGRIIDRKGYVLIWTGSKHEREHRIVMEEHLGRKLTKHETVHHRNGNRTDNSLENLELWSSSHPSGQRVEDKIAWAKEFLATYNDTIYNVEVDR